MGWTHPNTRKGRHLTMAQVSEILTKEPGLVLTRSEGIGFFPSSITRTHGVQTTTVTFRTCEALVKRNVIKLSHASAHAGYWVAA